MEIELIPVKITDAEFLYDLLKERTHDINISHSGMPTYTEHEKFIRTNNYYVWYIIVWHNNKIGSIYLTDRHEIGVFIGSNWQRKGFAKKAILVLMKKHKRPYYLANINPNNETSKKFFMRLGFELIQYTYRLVGSEKVIKTMNPYC